MRLAPQTPCNGATPAILGPGFIPHFGGKAMTIFSRPGRAPAAVQSWLARILFGFCSLFLLGFSQQAAATFGCEIQDQSVSATQSGPAGTTLNYSFLINDTGGCPGTVSGTITKTFDSTGGASSTNGSWSGAPGATINVVVTLGPNAASTSTFQVDCTVGCFNGPTQIIWTANTDDVF